MLGDVGCSYCILSYFLSANYIAGGGRYTLHTAPFLRLFLHNLSKMWMPQLGILKWIRETKKRIRICAPSPTCALGYPIQKKENRFIVLYVCLVIKYSNLDSYTYPPVYVRGFSNLHLPDHILQQYIRKFTLTSLHSPPLYVREIIIWCLLRISTAVQLSGKKVELINFSWDITFLANDSDIQNVVKTLYYEHSLKP